MPVPPDLLFHSCTLPSNYVPLRPCPSPPPYPPSLTETAAKPHPPPTEPTHLSPSKPNPPNTTHSRSQESQEYQRVSRRVERKKILRVVSPEGRGGQLRAEREALETTSGSRRGVGERVGTRACDRSRRAG